MSLVIERKDIPRIISFFILIYSIFLMYTRWEDTSFLSADGTTLQLTIISFLIVIFNVVSWMIEGNRFVSLFIIFYMYTFLSNVGQEIMIFFPNALYTATGSSIATLYSTHDINQWFLFQCVCSAALGFGGNLMGRRYARRHECEYYEQNTAEEFHVGGVQNSNEMIYKTVYYICLAATLLFAIQQVVLRTGMSYEEYRDVGTSSSSIANFFFSVLSCYFLIKNKDDRVQQNRYIYPMLVLIILFFAAGTRSQAMPLIMILIYVIRETKPNLFRKKYIPVYIIGIILFFYLTNVISSLRENAISSLSLADLFTKSLADGFLNMIYEMGISTNCGIVSMNTVQSSGTHYSTILYYFIRAFIPGSILNIFGFAEPACGRLSDWVSELGGFSYSIGFSCFAEAYVNFDRQGWLFMLVYGVLIVYLEMSVSRKIEQGKILYPCIMLTLLAKQIFFARAQFDLISTYLRLSFIVFLVWIFLSQASNGGVVRAGRN